jgi:hypothetical protein
MSPGRFFNSLNGLNIRNKGLDGLIGEVEDEIAVDGIELPLRADKCLLLVLVAGCNCPSHRLQHLIVEALNADDTRLTRSF